MTRPAPVALTLPLTLALALIAVDCAAQSMPRRERPLANSPRESYRESPRAIVPDDPFSALERELPSLKVDLRLTAEQVNAWSAFERDVREVAEMDRAKRRRLMALRNASESPPGALALVGGLADDERNKADATADLRHHLEALYSLLDDTQRKVLDRRLWLSQTEPLGK